MPAKGRPIVKKVSHGKISEISNLIEAFHSLGTGAKRCIERASPVEDALIFTLGYLSLSVHFGYRIVFGLQGRPGHHLGHRVRRRHQLKNNFSTQNILVQVFEHVLRPTKRREHIDQPHLVTRSPVSRRELVRQIAVA